MAWSEKLVHMAGATGAWAALSALCRIVLGEAYLFQWMVHNWRVPLALWLAALVLILAGRPIPAWALTAGHGAGLFLGQYLGDWLLARSTAQIAPDLEAGMQAQLMTHMGFPIWLVVLLAALIAGAAISRLRRGRGREETA